MAEHRTALPVAYFVVFGGLLLLTVTTVAVAGAPLGGWHIPAALAIAGTKAGLVVVFFMHALRGPKLTRVIIVVAIFWLLIMLTFTLADYLTR
jgi:cytochrome c oxidase subunit 4